MDVIYLDFQKAFDKVPHKRLIMKLNAMGIKGKTLHWIENWLSGRLQRVVINGVTSSWAPVISGVPQGSVLGPVLFVIYINDLEVGLKNKIFKFADDSKVLAKVGTKGDIDDLRMDLVKLSEWTEKWQMELNLEKCKVLHLGNKNGRRSYLLEGIQLADTKEERDLGIIIRDDLKFHTQVAEVAKKCNKLLGLIYRTFTCKRKDIIIKLYKSIIRPHMDYCSQAWRPHHVQDIELLERVQKRATRMIEECKGKTYQQRMDVCNLTTLETRRIRADLIEVYKILKGKEGVDKGGLFIMADNNNRKMVTRGHSMKLYQRQINTDIGKFSFSNRVVHEWNILTEEMIQVNSVDTFKGRLDYYLRHIKGFVEAPRPLPIWPQIGLGQTAAS